METNKHNALSKNGEQEQTVEMNIPSGWSTISVPVAADTATALQLFAEAESIYSLDQDFGYVEVSKGGEPSICLHQDLGGGTKDEDTKHYQVRVIL